MIEKLTKECMFQRTRSESDEFYRPQGTVGYYRCYHDGFRWIGQWWPVQNVAAEDAIPMELNRIFMAFAKDRAVDGLLKLAKFCNDNAERTDDPDEFYMYMNGEHAYYWFRFITRRGDYNLYLYAIRRDS